MCIAILLSLTSTAALAVGPAPAVYQTFLESASPGSKISCVKDSYGNPACTVDGVEIDVVDEYSNMFFGGVTDEKGVTLDDRFESAAAKPVAHIGTKQLLCVQASVTKQGVLIRALVKAIPTKTVKECKGNDMCVDADTHVEWKRPVSGTACTLKADGHYVGDCPTGWVDGDKIEEYSLGLDPVDTGA